MFVSSLHETPYLLMSNWQKIKDQVAELDKKTRTIVGLINKVHSTPPESREALSALFPDTDVPSAQFLLSLTPHGQSCSVVRSQTKN